MDEKQTKPRRPLWFWLFIGLGVVVLIFGLGAPSALSSGNEKSVTYDVFLTDLETGKVKEVELKSGIRDAAIDYFDLQRQILTQEIDIVRQYPYMLHFLESVKMETDKKGLAAIEAPEEVSDDYYEYLENEAQLGGYLRVMNAQHLSGMLYYVKMGLLRRYLAEPEFRPDAYKQEVLDYINTLQQMAAAL